MRIFLLCLFTTLLIGCGQKSGTRSSTEGRSASELIALAETAQAPQKSQYLVEAGIILSQKAEYMKAQEVFSFVQPTQLSTSTKDNYFYYYALTLYKLTEYVDALKLIGQVTAPELQAIEWQVGYQTLLSDLYFNDGNYFESAKIRIEVEPLLLSEQSVIENHQAIWRALNEISPQLLSVYRTDFSSSELNGWLELASLTKANVEQPQSLINAVQQWQQRYPNHPANTKLPTEIDAIASAEVFKPKQIALLLPLSGRLSAGGQMIRDGFFAAHYNSPQAPDTVIRIYDTGSALSATEPYQKAIEDGADFVVGPLTKEAVEQIVQLEVLDVPQLSLNRLDASQSHLQLFQFGLPVEDEAKQIAKLAVADNHSKALILAPRTATGERIVSAFRQVFEELRGEVAEVQWFDESSDVKGSVVEALNIDLSQQRANRLRQILGRPFEYTQRRRQDADMVFVVAPPTDARRIKPFLNYYFAQDLPVYSVSRIYSGRIQATQDKDLNQVIFSDIPLLLSQQPEIKQLRKDLFNVIPNAASPLGRLFALGYDAYQIIPNLDVMRSFEQYTKQGLSGRLSVDQDGLAKRRLSIAKFEQGRAIEITSQDSQSQ